MAERFEKLFSLPPNLYSEGSPVIISAGVLLKDKETDRIIAQIKYHSVSVAPIVALKVGVSAYDISGKEVDGISEYQYLDLNIHNGQDFGSNKAIVFQNNVTRSFSFNNVTVILSDGTNYSITLPMTTLPQVSDLKSNLKNSELVKQYQLSVNKEAVYVPQENGELWSCSCGEWNKGSLCSKCRANKKTIFSAFNVSLLTTDMEHRLTLEKKEKENRERAAEQARLNEVEREKIKKEQRDKRIKKIVKLLPIFIGVIFSIIVLSIITNEVKKTSIYDNALKLMETGKYEKALCEFATIPKHKDSSEKMKEIMDMLVFTDDDMSIRKAIQLLEIYPVGNEKLLELCQYIYLVEDNKYSQDSYPYEAYELYSDYHLYNGVPYADVEYENYLGVLEDKAEVNFSSDPDFLIEITVEGKFKEQNNTMYFAFAEENAKARFDDGDEYTLPFDEKMNKPEYVTRAEKKAKNEDVYQKANKLFYKKKYDKAIDLYTQIITYKDSEDKIELAEKEMLLNEYSKAEKLLNEGKKIAAAIAFYKLGNYEDAWERSFEIWGEITHRDTITAHDHNSLAVKNDGTVVATGGSWDSELAVDSWFDIVSVGLGERHSVGLKNDGTVVATGYDGNNRLSVDSWSNIVAISAGRAHTVGLRADGTVVAVGENYNDQCEVNDWSDIIAISAGSYHTVGLKTDGTVVSTKMSSFADDNWGQCDVDSWTDIVSISAHDEHTVGLKKDGTVIATGLDWAYAGVEKWKNIVDISASGQHTFGVKSDGTVLRAGRTVHDYGSYDVSGWKNIVAIYTSPTHTLGLKTNGKVVAIGNNEQRQCDVSQWKDILIP